MAKYIDLEKALAFPFANGNYDSKHAISIFILGCESYREYLETIPAADVVSRDCYDRLLAENDELRKARPVVRGEWIWEQPNSANRFRGCFLCNKCFETVYTKKNFCPNCGARMDDDDNV